MSHNTAAQLTTCDDPSIIEQLITTRMNLLVIKKSQLVMRWGYRNVAKGIRRLDKLMGKGFLPETLISKLAAALELPEADLRQAIVATQEKIRQDEWQKALASFKPHAILRTEHEETAIAIRPSSLAMVCMSGISGRLRIDLDQEQTFQCWVDNIVQQLPTDFPFLGKIMGFYINLAPDRAIEFDRKGNMIQLLWEAKRLREEPVILSGPNIDMSIPWGETPTCNSMSDLNAFLNQIKKKKRVATTDGN